MSSSSQRSLAVRAQGGAASSTLLLGKAFQVETFAKHIRNQLFQGKPTPHDVVLQLISQVLDMTNEIQHTHTNNTSRSSFEEMEQAIRRIDERVAETAQTVAAQSTALNGGIPSSTSIGPSSALPPPYSLDVPSGNTNDGATIDAQDLSPELERTVCIKIKETEVLQFVATSAKRPPPHSLLDIMQGLFSSHPDPAISRVQLQSASAVHPGNATLRFHTTTRDEARALEFRAEEWIGMFGQGAQVIKNLTLITHYRNPDAPRVVRLVASPYSRAPGLPSATN